MGLGHGLSREGLGRGVGTRGWMPPRQLVAAVLRGSRGVIGEGVGEGPGTRGWCRYGHLNSWMPPRQLVAAVPRWSRVVVGRRGGRGRGVGEGGCRSASVRPG